MYKLQNGFKKWEMISLIEQFNNGKKSFSERSSLCVYETADGNHCAVGCFIPDGHPGLKSLETVQDLLFKNPDLLPCMPLGIAGMMALQKVHDTYRRSKIDVRTKMINWVNNNVRGK